MIDLGDRVIDTQWPQLGPGTIIKTGTDISLVRWDNYLENKIPKDDYIANRHLAAYEGSNV
jgi:hypothetical protein